MVNARRQIILGTVNDLVADFMYYDRKDDHELPREAIEEAIKAGEITETEIVARFAEKLRERLS